MRKPTYRSPSDLADEMTRKHAEWCDDCVGHDLDEFCDFHRGYREGVTTLLLRASVG